MKSIDDILNLVTGTSNDGAKNETLSELANDRPAKEEFTKIKNAWALASTGRKMPDYRVEQLYLDFQKQLNSKRKTIGLFPSFLKYAAVFILAIGISSVLDHFRSEIAPAFPQINTVIAENGQISKVILPDSSVVWLNSGTQISYRSDFSVSDREISLTGQAFFQVTKNEKLPLKVRCRDLEVKVLGTRFDVSAYPEDKNVRVFLESGKVEIGNSTAQSSPYRLHPGEMAEYNKQSGNMSRSRPDPGKFISWKEGILVFRDDPMEEVIPKLQRRYNIEIDIASPAIYQSVFTATLKNETLEEVFKSISFACSVQYQIVKGEHLNTKTKVLLYNR
ncbi:MAG: FecR domain-containing protein [Prolixibacteraceae bacterium]